MATASTENDLSIKGLYNCVPFYDERPDEIIPHVNNILFFQGEKSGITSMEEGSIQLYDEYKQLSHVFYNKHTRIEKGEGYEVYVFHKKYRDPFSGKTYSSDRMMELRDGYVATNYYEVYTDTNYGYGRPCMYYWNKKFVFVLNIENNYKKTALTLKLIEKHLEKKEGQNRLSVELMSKIGNEYFGRVKSVPSDFQLKYKKKFPKIVSMDQLKKLYDAGFIDVAYNFDEDVSTILSDEAFDSNGISGNLLRRHYKSKEAMNIVKQASFTLF